jgi:hypothetical protein
MRSFLRVTLGAEACAAASSTAVYWRAANVSLVSNERNRVHKNIRKPAGDFSPTTPGAEH